MPHRYDNQHAQQADESRKTGGCPLRAERRSRSGPSDQTKPARAGRRSRSGPANQTKPARAGAAEPERAIKPASQNPDTPRTPYSGTLTGDTSVFRLKSSALISMLLLCLFLLRRWHCRVRTGLSLSGWRALGTAAWKSVPGSCWPARIRPEVIPGWLRSWDFRLRRCGSGARGSPSPGRVGSRTPGAPGGGRRASC